ncbi:hypothetical protein HN643_00570 [Candidatus Falkowbacteria bacterium]|jgi:hypothetical protein|nr:hypothetical protein [Candidatus Falkowbacteria bacterium]MBT5503350.1 hypothetical protein [Candidatus Falkowbacteria bacterium]MBT6573680.1 hypothetical protein [Candidatus Falkowbacteria bacterium]MBT7500151.1 hypothetical protein [Candidatus Falkowbacteria bacterium]
MTKNKQINIDAPDDLEKIEEDIIRAAEKAGKKNVIVNIFTYPHKKLKKRWHVRYKFNKKHLLMDLVIAAGVLVLIGLNIFWLWGGFHYFTNKLNLEITAPSTELTSGQQVTFEINYANDNKFELQDFVMSFRYPEYFELDEVSRAEYDFEHNVIELGNLEAGANGKIEVSGQVWGDIDDEQLLFVSSNFYKTNKKNDRLWGQFSESEIFKFSIVDSYLDLSSDLPDKLVKGQIFTWPVHLENTSADITYEYVELQPMWDDQPIGSHDGWSISDFGPGQKSDFVIGHTAYTDKENVDVQLNVVWHEENRELVQARIQKQEQIFDPEFSIVYDVEVEEAVTPGESVPVTVTYSNQGKYTIENLHIELQLSGDYWQVSKTEADQEVVIDSKNKTVIWDYKQNPSLALVQPKETKSLKLTLATREYVSGSQSISLTSGLKYRFKVEGQEVEIQGLSQSEKLNSNLSVQAYPMYYAATGDQLGRGPIPPRVGKETKYWIFAKMINDINDVENATVSAKLPFNVVWLDESNVPVGDPIIYNSEDKTITWNISQVSVDAYNLGFAFQVAIVPTASQQGSYPALLTDVSVRGTDKVTGNVITKNLGAVTTKLIYDNKGKLKDGPVK